MDKKITVSLSASDMRNLAKELRRQGKTFDSKVDEFRERIAEEIKQHALSIFSDPSSQEDRISKQPAIPDYDVTVNSDGKNTTVVVASGKDVLFMEFGAGVFNNTPTGTSPHPLGEELGFTIGSFGQGQGAEVFWGFYEGGVKARENLRLTRGTPSSAPMYNALEEVSKKIEQIAKEVFS